MSEENLANTPDNVEPATSAGTPMRMILWGLAVAVVSVLLDQGSKIWALGALSQGERIPLLGDALGLELIFNPGAALSLGENSTIIFTVISTAVVVGMPFLLRTTVSLPWTLALGAIWGGAAGNLIDRIFRAPGPGRGHVVDFIAYFDWFIGNVADVILFLAIIAILVLALRDIPRSALDMARKSAEGARKSGKERTAHERPALLSDSRWIRRR